MRKTSSFKKSFKKVLSAMLAVFLLAGTAVPAAYASEDGLIGSRAVERYEGDEGATAHTKDFIKISHPEKPVSKRQHDPTEDESSREAHQEEVFTDGLLDYIGDEVLGVPGTDAGADGQGDRGQTYSWAGFAYGDWMYVSTLFNSTESTGRLLGRPADPQQLDEAYGGDLFVKEPDDLSTGSNPDMVPGSTLCKINVKTGEIRIIMSKTKNGLETSFRNAVEYHGKLYFCGSVNHLPSIYEIDPETDAFQCVYQDPSIRDHPGGPGAAWAESLEKEICPTIRGLTVFKDYLVISTVGTDGNPYIAVSQDPTKGFQKIASTWSDAENQVPGELLGYSACKIPDSIMGGSIWEMIEFNDSLYVAICTGTPANAPESHTITTEDGQSKTIIDTMQSFALIRGDYDPGDDPEHPRSIADPAAWTWTPVIGDTERDGARYTFGIDPERHRSSACNMVVFGDYLYIGEYNDTQISFRNMTDSEFDFLARNMDESVSLYRMDREETIEKVMGDPTEMFPEALSGINESGFGKRESQYIWQMKVFNDRLYVGTFDETMILGPLAKAAYDMAQGEKKLLDAELAALESAMEEADASASLQGEETLEDDARQELAQVRELLETRTVYQTESRDTDFLEEVIRVPEMTENELLPASLFEKAPLVTVDSPETLYLALLAARDLLSEEDLSTAEQLSAFWQYSRLREEITAYCSTRSSEVPALMSETADALAEPRKQDKITDLAGVLMYLKECIPGFDMYVSEDGVHFDQITRSGMGDPYNQGLRVFAVNDTDENPWMCIGTANPFYGTQIWRMEDPDMNPGTTQPAQKTVKIQFVTQLGTPVKRDWDKADEIYVEEGVTQVDPADISILIPKDHKLQSTSPVTIRDGAVTIRVLPQTKDVRVSFVDVDKHPSDQLVGTAIIRVGKSRPVLSDSDLESFIPEGYVRADSRAVQITTAPDGTDEGYVASVPVKRTFSLAVENGGAFLKKEPVSRAVSGAEITVKAAAPEGQRFLQWTSKSEGVVFEDPAAPETTFIMPAENVTVTAVCVGADTFNITVTGGTADRKAAAPGERVTVTAETVSGQQFAGWTCEDPDVQFEDAGAAETSFTMPGRAVAVTAAFTPKTVTGIAVTTPPDKVDYLEGEAFDPAGMVVTASYEDGTSGAVTGFTIADEDRDALPAGKESVTIRYIPEAGETAEAVQAITVAKTYSVTVEDDGSGTGSAAPERAPAGAEVVLTAHPNPGFRFQEWQVVSGDVQIAESRFVMPAGDVVVRAVFAPETYPVRVNGGSGSGAYRAGERVTIQADSIPGKAFLSWTAEGAELENRFSPETSFLMPAGPVTVTASYQEAGTPPAGEGFTVSGTVESYLNERDTVTVALFAADREEASYTASVTGSSAAYTISGVAPGTYTMQVSKDHHAVREYTVRVTKDTVQNARIHPLGDVTQDGNVTLGDWMCLYDHFSGYRELSGYALECANVVPDAAVAISDWMRLYDHLSGVHPLW